MMLKNFLHFPGVNCESTAIKDLLAFNGLHLSEPMIFGLGSGLGFFYWDMKKMLFPFVGGRIKPDQLMKNLAENIGFDLIISETSSSKKAHEKLIELLKQNTPVGLKLDMYYFEYRKNAIHFPAHYVVACGFDGSYIYLADTDYKTVQRTSVENLIKARSAKGPLSSKNLSLTIEKVPHNVNIKDCIINAIHKNVESMLNPPIKNLGVKGIETFAREIKKWHKRSNNMSEDCRAFYIMWEKAGTGGAGFRRLYRDFLEETLKYVDSQHLKKACNLYHESAVDWTKISGKIANAWKSENIEKELKDVSELIEIQAHREKEAMECLRDI